MQVDLGRDKTVSEIISRIGKAKPSDGPVKVGGTWGSFCPMLAAYISQQLKRPILYVSPHIDDADKAADDFFAFGAQKIDIFPAWEGQENITDPSDEILAERLKVALKVALQKERFVISASAQSICRPIPDLQELISHSIRLDVGKQISPQDVTAWLVDNKFERVESIDLPGQFAQRGGIVDIYSPLSKTTGLLGQIQQESEPSCSSVRIEFFGDTIESIRKIDMDTQRSSGQMVSVSIFSAVTDGMAGGKKLFVNILPRDCIVILEEPSEIEEVLRVFTERSEDLSKLYRWEDIYRAFAGFSQLHVCRFAASASGDLLRLGIKSIQQFQHKTASAWTGHKQSLLELIEQAENGRKVYLYCDSPAEAKRINEIAFQEKRLLPEEFKLLVGFIHHGFFIEPINTIVLAHHELFGQYTLMRRQRPIQNVSPLDTLTDLQYGDYVVHTSYGIGRFLGVKTIHEKDKPIEYLTIEYADDVKIQVSMQNIALVQKYIGTSPKRPKLSKIGSKRWQQQKAKVAKSIRDLASELLEIQAMRKSFGGIAFEQDSNLQLEFDQSFPYQETPDQTTAMEQIKSDMCEPMAMDRLLCGDVGYGKTELAMRAAFKAVENGKQVAVLVPTTVLSVQHGRTFTERFADFPVSIEVLNRFKTQTRAKDIIKQVRAGKVDILIGTHRILSKDIGFKDLGLVIIDEEQRFGVKHKERLKNMRVNVDVLTMTATPIPRTLHISMLGLRDISSLFTPPLDRRSIVTMVAGYNHELIKREIIRELNRQGQAFFVHNRVKTIEKKALEIRKIVADAKVAVAHGRMSKRQLEKVMIDFVSGRVDVLVCTTIIESGLDIPNANTIFIDNADKFGLAELHQLRGRVGRYKHRAYAYLLLPADRPIAPLAAKRIKAIEEYSHLGAGFRIALRDLEIRGAGNILGSEQSGHIQMVGYQMYCELLTEAVRRLKGEHIEPVPAVIIDLGFSAYIQKNYIPSERQRLNVYQKIASARTEEDIEQSEETLADLYGPIPDEVRIVLELARLRIVASRLDIKSIIAVKQGLMFSFTKTADNRIRPLLEKAGGRISSTGPDAICFHLDKSGFEPKAMFSILRKIFH